MLPYPLNQPYAHRPRFYQGVAPPAPVAPPPPPPPLPEMIAVPVARPPSASSDLISEVSSRPSAGDSVAVGRGANVGDADGGNDGLFASSGVSLHLEYISEETELAGSANSTRRYYESALREKGVEINMPVLRAMAAGELTEEESQAARIAQFVNRGWLKSRETKKYGRPVQDQAHSPVQPAQGHQGG